MKAKDTPNLRASDFAQGAPSHLNPRRRAAAAFAAGCLALTLCPAAAFAAPSGPGGAPQGGMPPAMQQDAAMPSGQAPDGQAPDGQAPAGQAPDGQAPDGQAPEGQPMEQAPDGQAPMGQAPDGQADGQASDGQPSGQAPDDLNGDWQSIPGDQPRSDALDDQIRQELTDSYGIQTERPAAVAKATGQNGQPGSPEDAPEIPEGETNVQQVIDAIRDVLRQYSSEDLASKLSDADFVAEVQAYAKSATASRLAAFASGQKPASASEAAGQAPESQGDANAQAPSGRDGDPADGTAPANAPDTDGFDAAQAIQNVDSSLIGQIASLVMAAFGYTSAA